MKKPDITPAVKVEFVPRHGKDKKPYRASIVSPHFQHFAEAASPSEALLLAAARWHSYADAE